ncbi:FG-GAP repeat domain-containing protein [Pseudooctadecabacter jejudonensis]|nr:VCBS repeat-containing protein [Pseudooctadecabacter jejudonensis]
MEAPRRPVRGWRGPLRGVRGLFGLGLAGLVAGGASAETIVEARFEGPTTRYGHGILGDAVEFTQLVIMTDDAGVARQYRVSLPDDHVFEDLEPRLWDITGDGAPEVVVIETDMGLGGSLAVYDQTGKRAETPHIGRTNRWLAPVAAADLDGDGRVEVAFVDRPHLAKVLRVFEWDGSALQLEAELGGLTNHRIGEDFITGGLRTCDGVRALVTADADWSDVMVSVLADGALVTRSVAPFSHEAVARAMTCG